VLWPDWNGEAERRDDDDGGSAMRSIIRQSIVLPATPEALHAMYLDPAIHAQITGAPVTIAATSGAPFRAFEGQLSGTILVTVAPTLIVQSWRSVHFNDDDPDSTLILSFAPAEGAARIDLVHLDVPEQDYQGVTEGWEKFYWSPWREYLASG
jgi:Activator of Hsp90 ATPase homolog 1-like protein